MPPNRRSTIGVKASVVLPKEEEASDFTSTLAKLKLSKPDGEIQPTAISEVTRRTPSKKIFKSDIDVKPPRFSVPDLYPPALQDVKLKVDAQELVGVENVIVAPREFERHTHPRIEIVLPSWKDVRKAKADRARAARGKPRVRNARHPAATDVDAKVDLSLADMADVDPPGHAALRGAVEEMKNPDAKVKEELLLSDAFLLAALTWEGINHRHPVPLPKHIAEFGFSRAYISHLYGGNPQDVFPPPHKDKVAWHGLNDWAFLSLELNPHAPTRPGFSGLYFTMDRAAACDERETLRQVKRTFVRLAPNRWIYLGQYTFTPGVSLTTALWTEQRIQVRRAWARGVLYKGWGAKVLLRIWFRRERGVDFEPKEDDMEDAEGQVKQIRTTMSEEDIMGPYDRGEEEIGTFRMMCTGYDAEFLSVLQRNAHSFVPPLPKHKKSRSRQQKKEGETSTRGKKRKAGSTINAKYSAEAKSESDEDDAHVQEHWQKFSISTARESTKRRKLA
ncbi:hypothetical protein V8D89_016169 [Ganoderma adspersum]